MNVIRCEYCGKFISKKDIGNKTVFTSVQVGFECIDYDFYYHKKCKK
jgi:hypothetical protein